LLSTTEKDFSIDEIVSKMKRPEVGGFVIFLGVVRGLSRGERIERMTVEAYEEMARMEMDKLRKRALEKFKVTEVTIIHRIGDLKPSENIVLVAVSAPHREEAFEACHWLIDEIKKIVPIWKKEKTPSSERWVKEDIRKK